MKLPRWTVYPAIGVLATLVVTALPHAGKAPEHSGRAKQARMVHALRQDAEQVDSQRVEVPVESDEDQPEQP